MNFNGKYCTKVRGGGCEGCDLLSRDCISIDYIGFHYKEMPKVAMRYEIMADNRKLLESLTEAGKKIQDMAIKQFSLGSVDMMQKLISGTWNLDEIKTKARFISFEHEGRIVTLAGKRTSEKKITVGHSVYCDHLFDKRKNDKPKNKELSKKIALGRLEKKPIYGNTIDLDAESYIIATLETAKNKILRGELKIKGIRNPKK